VNRARRERLDKALAAIAVAAEEVDALANEEREAFDNLPEGLQQAERGQEMETMADELDTLADSVRECAEWVAP